MVKVKGHPVVDTDHVYYCCLPVIILLILTCFIDDFLTQPSIVSFLLSNYQHSAIFVVKRDLPFLFFLSYFFITVSVSLAPVIDTRIS